MTDQGLGGIAQVLSQTPGITVVHDNGATTFTHGVSPSTTSMRRRTDLGLHHQYQRPGHARHGHLRSRRGGARGATGLMSGVGSPSGAVNLVRKRPTKEFQGYISGSGGSDRYRSERTSGADGKRCTARACGGRRPRRWPSFIDRYSSTKDVFYGRRGGFDRRHHALRRYRLSADQFNGSSFGQLPLYYNDSSRTHFKHFDESRGQVGLCRQ